MILCSQHPFLVQFEKSLLGIPTTTPISGENKEIVKKEVIILYRNIMKL